MTASRRSARARATLRWMVLGFFLLQLLFVIVVDGWFPLFFDPETAVRLRELQAHVQAEPERPLLLLIGSSRTCMSFRPEVLGPLLPDPGPQPLVYNYSHVAATPAFHLLQLQRLIQWKIKPRWVVVEVIPVWLSREGTGLLAEVAVTPELPFLLRYTTPKRVLRNFFMTRIVPWHRNRTALLEALAPGWAGEVGPREDPLLAGHLGHDNRAWSWLQDPAFRRRQLEVARRDYGPALKSFQLQEWLTRPVADLVAFCRREQIELVLMLSPESSLFRSWYAPGSETQIQAFFAGLKRQHGVATVDCRHWLPDEAFYDGHHVLERGADTFTRRLEQEVLRPLVREGSSHFQSPSRHSASR